MKLKLSDYASIAEIVSGLAVVITLVFLALEIRDNTEATRADAFDRNISSLNEIRGWIANSPDLTRAWRAYADGQSARLDETELNRLGIVMVAIMGVYEKAYFARKAELIGDSEWSRFEPLVCGHYEASARAGILKDWQSAITTEFHAFIEERCQTTP
jgi:hypothetical protein